jgi:hypothetical protein
VAELSGRSGPVLSPDGRRIAYVHEGKLWIRELASIEPRVLPGPENAERPFWSPGSDWLGYFVGTSTNAAELWKVPVHSGPAARGLRTAVSIRP